MIEKMIAYAVKMLTMPTGTRYEIDNQPVGRITYTVETCRMLWRSVYPISMWQRIQQKKRLIAYQLETYRWNFFDRNPVGKKILTIADQLHDQFPQNGIIKRLWDFCLPF